MKLTPVQAPSFTSNNRYNEFAFYAQDNWSISDRLKLNLGLRYEYYGPQQKNDPKYDSNFYYGDPSVSVSTSTPQQIIDGIRSGSVLPSNQGPTGTLWKSDWNNFAPRVGFAWNPRQNIVFRMGYAMSSFLEGTGANLRLPLNPPFFTESNVNYDPRTPGDIRTGFTDVISAGNLASPRTSVVLAVPFSPLSKTPPMPGSTAMVDFSTLITPVLGVTEISQTQAQ